MMKKNSKAILLIFAICIFVPFSLTAKVPDVLSIPDSSEIRKNTLESWLLAPKSELTAKESQNLITSYGQVFQIKSEVTESEIIISIAPRKEDYTFDYTAAGSWRLVKNAETETMKEVRFFFLNDPNIYIRLLPDKQPDRPKVRADLIIYNSYVARNIPVGLQFEDILTLSFSELYELTYDVIPWDYVKFDPRKYSNNQYMISEIRKNLPRFEYLQDTCYDENKNPVTISTNERRSKTPGKLGVDESGFTKWIADGITYNLNEHYLRVEPLKRHTVNVQNTMYEPPEIDLQVFASLNWTRNLAAALISAATDKDFDAITAGTDVLIEPFSSVTSNDNSGVRKNVGYIKNTGYDISMLKSLFFVLASTEPDMFYFGAIKTRDEKFPEQWVFSHEAVFFPYFDKSGICQIAVFECGVETDFDTFIQNNPDTFVHLVRAKATDNFMPY
ncbi:MAG: hypothetical protein J6T84_02700 [Spirochaetaceae bacterium]|nr:hypothetical protein [Spirochaetaceae bacterium]